MRLPLLRAVFAAAALAATGSPAGAQQPLPAARTSGVARATMDTSCSPCRDFYRFANGAWLDSVAIPADRPTMSAGSELRDRNEAALRRILERTAGRAATERDATLQKLGGFQTSCVDSARADRAGVTPIAAELRRIDGIGSARDLQRVVARLHRLGVDAAFSAFAFPDLDESSRNLGYLYQGGLGLPDRDYYTRTDSASEALRRDYQAHVGRMLRLLGRPGPDAAAARIVRLETALANASLTAVEQRDPHAFFQKRTVADVQRIAPRLDWVAYFSEVGVPSLARSDATLSAAPEKFFRTLDSLVAATPVADWRAYLAWRLADATAPSLSTPFVQESFRLASRLSGAREMRPRWQRCAAAADQWMGEALGQAYVAEEFSPAAKARMVELVDNLKAVMRERIRGNAWMSDSTRAAALRKLDRMVVKVGYPDQWRDYGALTVDARAPYGANVLRAREFEARRQLAKIGQAVDRGEWNMTAPTVNAYHNPPNNEIVFPAGILQSPYFDVNADDAVNYGAIGMVIGHEITHAFDDLGRQFDDRGQLRDWWTAADAKGFTERADVVVNQYNGYVAVDTLRVNGKLTLGENIADLGGLTMAYYAYQRSLEKKPRQTIDGFTPEQRFFLGAAQAWRNKTRPESLQRQVLTDPHSPSMWRVIGPMSNMPEFARAFGCKPGDRMVRADTERAAIW
ncbi:MAG TPA: M13 family metallopeptidase [Gemmatimonadaceae bacterium]|nr:M13 family metallopeptidase [Gemmatimonadaceae bacterium]